METRPEEWRLGNRYHGSEAYLQEQQVQPGIPAWFYPQSERHTAEASRRTPAAVSGHGYSRSPSPEQNILSDSGPRNVADELQSSSELLSNSDEELEILNLDILDYPPPLTHIAYDPLLRPMSADTSSVTNDVPRNGDFTLPGHSIAHVPPRLHRVRRPAAPVPSAVRLGPQTQSTAEDQTDSDDVEVSRELRQLQIERLLATDRAFDSESPLPEPLALSDSQIDSRRQPQQARPQHTASRNDSNRHLPPVPQQQSLPADSQARESQNRYHRGTRVHEDRPVVQRTPQQSEPPRQETIVVQVPEEIFNPVMEFIGEHHLRQQAILEQYREVARYLRDLNQWMEREYQGRRDDFRRLDMRFSRLQDDVRRMGI